MTNLMPEQRVDKNGRVVTRHVRSTAQLLFGRSSIPAPQPHSYDANTAISDFVRTLEERGAANGNNNVTAIAASLKSVNEETRIMALTALQDHEDMHSTLMLSYALGTKDEQFIRTVSLSLNYCSAYIGAVASRENVDGKGYGSILGGMHHTHKGLLKDTSSDMPLADYDRERDELVATAYKVEHLSRFTNMSLKVPLAFEHYKQMSMLADNMEMIEDAVPAISDLMAALRHYAQTHDKGKQKFSLDAHDMMAIAEIVRDYPRANNHIYDIVVDHGSFDPDRIKLALESESYALVQGVL